MNLYEFEDSLFYRETFRTARTAQRNPVLKYKTNKQTRNGASKMAQWVKVLAPKFNPRGSHGKRKEPTLSTYSVISTYIYT